MAEKPLHDIPRVLRDQFDRGMAAYHKDNLDYAVTLFTAVLQKEPAFYECREALRAAQFRRRGAGRGLFKRLLGSASPGLAKGQLALRSDPAEAMHCAEQVLNEDPKNQAAHELVARAAMQCDLPRTAVLSLEIAFKNAPGNRAVALKLAEALIAAGQASRADRIYADLLAANPADGDVARAYKDLGARRSLHEKGYASFGSERSSFRDALKDRSEAESLEQESRMVKADDTASQLLTEYEARARLEPGNSKLQRKIAELHAHRKEFEPALAAYQKVVEIEGRSDAALEKTLAEIRLQQWNQRIDALDPASPDHPDARAGLERERDEFQLAECRARAERYPTDLAVRFELGELYYRAGRLQEAMQELQKAQANPHRRVAAMGLLARCFAGRGMNDIAARTLQNALKEKLVLDDEKKELLYELGTVLEKMGRTEEAVEQFKIIYEGDIGYRDVAARVDAYYASKAGG